MSSKKLRKVQLGFETTPGTGVPATKIIRLNGTLEDQREVKYSEEDVGYLAGVGRCYATKLGGLITLTGEATFEELPYILAMCIENCVTGSPDGSGTDFIYTYTLPSQAANTIKTATIENGDDQDVDEMIMGFCPSFTLTGVAAEEVKVSADIKGGEVSQSSFTGSLTLDDVETIMFGNSSLYIDAVTGTIGTTLVSNTLLGFSLKVSGGMIERWTGDGGLSPGWIGQGVPSLVLELTFEHNTNAVSEKQNWRSNPPIPRQLRIDIEGNAFTTGGTKYQNATLRIDAAGTWTKFSKIDEKDGNDIITATFTAGHDLTADFFAEIEVANEVSAL